MRSQQRSVSTCVLNDKEQPYRAGVLGLERVPLDGRGAKRRLEVRQPALDLRVKDVIRAEEDEVGGASERVANRKFERRLSGGMALGDEVMSRSHLAAVTKRWRGGRKGFDADPQANGGSDRAEGVQVHAGIAVEDSRNRGRRQPCAPRNLLDGCRKRHPRDINICPDLRGDPIGIVPGTSQRTVRSHRQDGDGWRLSAAYVPINRLACARKEPRAPPSTIYRATQRLT